MSGSRDMPDKSWQEPNNHNIGQGWGQSNPEKSWGHNPDWKVTFFSI